MPVALDAGGKSSRQRGDWPALTAGVVSLLPMFVLFVLLEASLVPGLASGAVKQ